MYDSTEQLEMDPEIAAANIQVAGERSAPSSSDVRPYFRPPLLPPTPRPSHSGVQTPAGVASGREKNCRASKRLDAPW